LVSAASGHLVNSAFGWWFSHHPPLLHPRQAAQAVMKLLYLVSRQKPFLAASVVVFSTQHVTFRLLWALTHCKQVRDMLLLLLLLLLFTALDSSRGCEL